MRYLLLPVLWIGIGGAVFAQQPPARSASPPAPHPTRGARGPLSPIGAAMANLTRALNDAAGQARHADAATDAASADPSPEGTPRAMPPETAPQPNAQAALP